MPQDNDLANINFFSISAELKDIYPNLLGNIQYTPVSATLKTSSDQEICSNIEKRLDAINEQIKDSIQHAQPEIDQAVRIFLTWMLEGTIVRIIGAGRARLAASIPANRLAHGGARVYIQDDILPMPHTAKGGGIIAASASGETKSVLSVLRETREVTRDVKIIGLAAVNAVEFKNYCDIFIGIQPESLKIVNPLRALADSEEYVISELLDAMVVAAGKLGGFDDAFWRLGHEDIGATGPYNFSL